MNSADFTFLLNQPAAVNDRQTDALEKIVSEFPYFQSARALRLKGLYNQNSFQYNYALKVAAAYTTDRSVLFDFITSDTFTAIHKGLYDKKLSELHGMEVTGSEIVVEEYREPAPAVDTVEASILSSIKESESPGDRLPGESLSHLTPPAEPVRDEVAAQPMEAVEITSTPVEPIDAAPGKIDIIEIPAIDGFEEIEFVPVEKPEPESNESETAGEFQSQAATPIPDESPEAKLHIGEPLEFSKTETHSFQEWLQLSRLQPIVRDAKIEHESVKPTKEAEPLPEPETNDQKAKKIELIDRFIETNPKIPQMKPDAQQVVLPESNEVHSSLMTETLARVYLEQKKYQKAIQAYEILILKYPEKSSFFADRISEIKNLQQNT